MDPIIKTAAGNPENQDRGATFRNAAGLVLVVADGAGGVSGGTEAAVMAIGFVREQTERLLDSAACAVVLQEMDQRIAADAKAGETTCVIAVITVDQILGASVGDSCAWIIGSSEITNLTLGQSRKPLIGSATAHAVPFERHLIPGDFLLLATDGLVKYTSADRIAAVCREHELHAAADKLIELVRYPSGALPDDVTVVITKL
jgi:serine/threonine protein phosphatase PrpC